LRGEVVGKFVFFNLPGAAGHINPSLGLVGELIQKGEQAIYYAGPESAEKLKALGAEPRTYHPYFEYQHNAAKATDIVDMSLTMLDLLERCVYGLRQDIAKISRITSSTIPAVPGENTLHVL